MKLKYDFINLWYDLINMQRQMIRLQEVQSVDGSLQVVSTHCMQSNPPPPKKKKKPNKQKNKQKLQRGSNGPVWSVQIKACIHENADQIMSQFPFF